MFADERRTAIMEMLQSRGSITVVQLMETFGVSIETVRRDLAHLENSRQLTRVHGGAILPKIAHKAQNLSVRLTENLEKKRMLCKTALWLVEPGDVIYIDSGATAIELATLIRDGYTNLTVITNSPDVFDILRVNEQLKLIIAGGVYMSAERAYHGYLTIDAIKSLHTNKAFLFPTALDADDGFFADHEPLLSVQRAAMQSADKTYLLADSSKFNQHALYRVSSFDSIQLIVTDSELSPHIAKKFSDSGIAIMQ